MKKMALHGSPGSSTVEHSAVNRQAVGSDPTRGANLKFLNQLDVARIFGSVPNAWQICKARKISPTRKQEAVLECRRSSVQIKPPTTKNSFLSGTSKSPATI